jgi:hypothetical protein
MNRRSFLATLLAPLAAPFALPLVVKRQPFKTALQTEAYLSGWTEGSSSPIEDIEKAMKLMRAQPAYRLDVVPYIAEDGRIAFLNGPGVLTPKQAAWRRAAKP